MWWVGLFLSACFIFFQTREKVWKQCLHEELVKQRWFWSEKTKAKLNIWACGIAGDLLAYFNGMNLAIYTYTREIKVSHEHPTMWFRSADERPCFSGFFYRLLSHCMWIRKYVSEHDLLLHQVWFIHTWHFYNKEHRVIELAAIYSVMTKIECLIHYTENGTKDVGAPELKECAL